MRDPSHHYCSISQYLHKGVLSFLDPGCLGNSDEICGQGYCSSSVYYVHLKHYGQIHEVSHEVSLESSLPLRNYSRLRFLSLLLIHFIRSQTTWASNLDMTLCVYITHSKAICILTSKGDKHSAYPMIVLGIKLKFVMLLIAHVHGTFDKYCMLLFIICVLAVVLTVGKKRLKNKIPIHAFKELRTFLRKSTEEVARPIMKSIETQRLVVV